MKAMTLPSRRDQDRLRWGWAGLAPLLLLLLLVDAHTGIALAPSAENRLPAFLGTLCSAPDRHSKAQTGRISRSTPEAYPRAKGARWAAGGGNDEQSTSLFKGLGVLEWANALVPQSALVKGARTSWNLIWKAMMAELAPQSADGSYVRPSYGFRGQLGTADFPLEEGRYHIYVGNACPWCHRVTLTHALKGLTQAQVSFSVVEDDPERASRGGWAFSPTHPDPVFNAKDLREVYERCSPGYRGRCTAPVMVDVKTGRLVNNESSDLIRLLNLFRSSLPPHEEEEEGAAEAAGGKSGGRRGGAGGGMDVDLCPPALLPVIDEVNQITYTKINNGVYRAGFATSQRAYDVAVSDVLEGLEWAEKRLTSSPFLAGDVVTEADVRLLPTILRFDAVYASLFLRCGHRTIRADYPRLNAWMARLYHLPRVKATIDISGLVRSYFLQLFPLNPSAICPRSPTEAELGLVPAPPRPSASTFYLRDTTETSVTVP